LNRTTKRVVIVDDEDAVLSLLACACRESGYTVNAFSCPISALDHIRNNQADIIITDFRMPKMNGLDLAQEARKVQPDVSVTLITGEYLPGPDAPFSDNVTHVLCKPVSLPNLLGYLAHYTADNRQD
jgi:DNA-binding NtrC family response regulator